MDSTTIDGLTPKEKYHVELMTTIARSLKDTPCILKGGTALLLAYQLDRFSEDLDFDCHKILHLENRIKKIVGYPFKLISLDTLKDTNTVTRYRLNYATALSPDNSLKIEISHRIQLLPDHHIINGIKVYKLPALIEQKLSALESRTTARDLYDINFLATHHLHEFTSKNFEQLAIFLEDLNSLEKRFMPAFVDDEILSKKDVSAILLDLQEITLKNRKNVKVAIEDIYSAFSTKALSNSDLNANNKKEIKNKKRKIDM